MRSWNCNVRVPFRFMKLDITSNIGNNGCCSEMINLYNIKGKRIYDWRLEPGKYIIGRSAACDLIIDDRAVSRKHAKLEMANDDNIFLTDLGSQNGTTVNGRLIREMISLKSDDLISFGGVGFAVKMLHQEKTHPDFLIEDTEENPAGTMVLSIEEALKPLLIKDLDFKDFFIGLSELGRMLVLPDSAESIFEQALKLLQSIIPCRRIALLLKKSDTDNLELASHITNENISKDSFRISRTIIQQVLDQKNAVLIADPHADDKFSRQHSIIASGLKSAMAVPLLDENQVLGILYVDTNNPLHRYNKDVLKVAAVLGNILAAKIVNHRLLLERQAKEALEAEMRAASQIQRKLLPAERIDVKGYDVACRQISCKTVGGDLYDIAKLKNNHYVFLAADVSGKGMGAALLMANILASFRILYDQEDFNALKTLKRISLQLLRDSRPEDFATVFIAELNTETNTVTYTNAGHTPALLFRKDRPPENLRSSGLPIGALDIFEWKENTVQIMEHEFLLIYTDGITETVNPEGEIFGEARLKHFVDAHKDEPPDEIINLILEETKLFSGDASVTDDITLMIIRRNS